jgi:hypothetical protein
LPSARRRPAALPRRRPPLAANALAQDCSDKNWKACKGKPWVIGNSMDTPLGDKWRPNKLWGAGDEAGSTNWYTKPEVLWRALAEAKAGKVYFLGRPYTSTMPTYGDRKFVLRIPGGPFGANVLVYNDEFVATEIGQVGTQFDGLAHIGIGMEVARWLCDVVQAGVVGADTWATEVNPNKEPGCAFCVHSHLLTRHGIVNQENMDLDALAADKAWRFMYVYSPVPIAGATGSIGAPLAIR